MAKRQKDLPIVGLLDETLNDFNVLEVLGMIKALEDQERPYELIVPEAALKHQFLDKTLGGSKPGVGLENLITALNHNLSSNDPRRDKLREAGIRVDAKRTAQKTRGRG